MNANHTACNHVDTLAANALCESFRSPAPKPTATRELTALKNKAIRAHRTYRTAKAANLNPIQSSREVQALAKYKTAKAAYQAACDQAGATAEKTWDL